MRFARTVVIWLLGGGLFAALGHCGGSDAAPAGGDSDGGGIDVGAGDDAISSGDGGTSGDAERDGTSDAGGDAAVIVPASLKPDCAARQGVGLTALPKFTGVLPAFADMSMGGASSYLYVLTQWGFARAPLGDNPHPYSAIIIGAEGGTGSGGLIPILCDCHQGSNTMDVAEGPGGDARLVLDWQPYAQGGPVGGSGFSGLPAMVAMTTGSGTIRFGQQIALPSAVPLGARIAAIYVASTSKYFAYYPVESNGVYLADVTTPTGSTSAANPIATTNAIGWMSGSIAGQAVRLRAANVGGASILAGFTPSDKKLHVADIDPATGALTETVSVVTTTAPILLEIGQVHGGVYVFGASTAGAWAWQYGASAHTLTPVTLPPGPFDSVRRLQITGPGAFPALLSLRDNGAGGTFVDVFDTYWLTQGGSPVRVASVQHLGAVDASYRGFGFNMSVSVGAQTWTGYLARELNPAAPGLPTVESQMHTDTIDLTCLAH
jgi:hypothetical protein